MKPKAYTTWIVKNGNLELKEHKEAKPKRFALDISAGLKARWIALESWIARQLCNIRRKCLIHKCNKAHKRKEKLNDYGRISD